MMSPARPPIHHAVQIAQEKKDLNQKCTGAENVPAQLDNPRKKVQ